MTRRRIRQPHRHFWLPAEDRALRKLYPHMRTDDIAPILGRTCSAIYARARGLRLAKSAAYNTSPLSGRNVKGHAIHGVGSRFAKGHVPWTKGKKGIRLSPRTEFKKGQVGTKFAPIGSERTTKDGILQRKVSATGYPPRDWKSVHALIWIEHHGPIPPGHIVVFRDRNRANRVITNLECITHRENMLRNTVHNLPKPIASAIQLLGQLKRRIRAKQDRGSEEPPVRNA